MTVLEVVREHLAAFNARDLDRVVDQFADDAVFANPDQLVIGRRGLRALFAAAFAEPVVAELDLRHAVVQGASVACEMTETLTTPDGMRAEFGVAAFYTVRDGVIARVRIYRDVLA